MKEYLPKKHQSHGTGIVTPEQISHWGENVVVEPGALIFHSENIFVGNNVYVGHYAILKGYYQNKMEIGDHCWIGQNCFFHSAGGIRIGEAVGIGTGVQILTSVHDAPGRSIPVLYTPVTTAPVIIAAGADIGIGSILLPGITIGTGAIVGAGSVVTKDIPAFEIWAGSPAKKLRTRTDTATPSES